MSVFLQLTYFSDFDLVSDLFPTIDKLCACFVFVFDKEPLSLSLLLYTLLLFERFALLLTRLIYCVSDLGLHLLFLLTLFIITVLV